MKILVLNGSPRRNGNTQFLLKGFKEGVEKNNHTVEILNVGNMKINGCIACDACKSTGKCVQKDDMDKVYAKLESAEMIVIASPVYYWGLSGQMQSLITRFYYQGILDCKKYALVLSSMSSGVYDAIVSQYKSMMSYFDAENYGIKAFNGVNQHTDQNYQEMVTFGESIGR